MSSVNVVEWYICFKDVEESHWFQKYLKKGFKHCYAFSLSPGGSFYQVVDPARAYTLIDLYPVNDEIFAELTNCHEYVKIVKVIDRESHRGTICHFNCVEVVKSLIGMASFFTFTPYQLYRKLKDER